MRDSRINQSLVGLLVAYLAIIYIYIYIYNLINPSRIISYVRKGNPEAPN